MGFLNECIWQLVRIIADEAKLTGLSVAREQLAKIRFNDALPKNAHIRHAIADSHIRALRRLVEQFEGKLQHELERDERRNADVERGEAFCREARKVIGRNRSIYLDPTEISATFSEEQGAQIFGTLMSPSFLDERQAGAEHWIRDAAWARLLSSMGYTEDMAPEAFRTMFDSPNGGYMANFAHCFRDRLKDPRNSEVFQITTALSLGQIREMLEGQWKSVEANLDQQRHLQELLLSRLSLGACRVLDRKRLERRESPGHPLSGFKYERALDDLVGRDAELFAMETEFLGTPALGASETMFRWQILCGDAGAGKSRFSMELIEHVTDFWPLSGFLNLPSETTDLSWLEMLTRPSFIVIDYAGGRASVPDLLRTLASLARSGQLPAPVRVLLLERRVDDPLFTRLFDIEALRDFGPGSASEIVELRQIDDASILNLMRARLGGRSAAFSDEELLRHLQDFDNKKRPLFASIVAFFLKTESLPDIDKDASAEQARWQLFRTLIRTWRENIWSVGAEAGEVFLFERLAALATMVRGLPIKQHKRLTESRGLGNWPPPDNRTFEYLARILGPMSHLEQKTLAYPAMEPDLAGECFVLGRAFSPAGGVAPLADEEFEALTAVAWHLAPWKAADFARRCYQSYPSATMQVGYLLPRETEADALLPKAMAVSSIIAEYVTRHRAKSAQQKEARTEAPSITEQKEILELYALFGHGIAAAAETDLEIARVLAGSTQQVVTFLARAINDRIHLVDNSLAQRLAAIAAAPGTSSDTSTVFNTGARGSERVLH